MMDSDLGFTGPLAAIWRPNSQKGKVGIRETSAGRLLQYIVHMRNEDG